MSTPADEPFDRPLTAEDLPGARRHRQRILSGALTISGADRAKMLAWLDGEIARLEGGRRRHGVTDDSNAVTS